MTILVSDLLNYARTLAQTDSNGLTDATGTAIANDALYDLRRKLVEKRQDLFVQESQRDITSTQITGGATPGKFLFPSDMWLLKNIQVNLQDTTNTDMYVEAKQVDSSNLPQGTSWEYYKKNQPVNQPVFDYRGDWFEIAPTPTITQSNAIKIFYFLAPTDIISTSGTLSFPETLDYRILSYKIASIYLATIGSDLSSNLNDEYEKRVNDFVGVIGTGEQAPTEPGGLKITGWEF